MYEGTAAGWEADSASLYLKASTPVTRQVTLNTHQVAAQVPPAVAAKQLTELIEVRKKVFLKTVRQKDELVKTTLQQTLMNIA